jgi:hypothetical protein
LLLGNNPSTHAQSYETIHQFLMLLNLLKFYISVPESIHYRLRTAAATKCEADSMQDVECVHHTLQTWQSVIIGLWHICGSEAAIKMLC